MSKRGGVDALGTAVTEAVQSDSGKILLDLAPSDWDSYGFVILDLALRCIGANQKRVVCRVGQTMRDIRWMTTVYTKADTFDNLDEAIAFLEEDC